MSNIFFSSCFTQLGVINKVPDDKTNKTLMRESAIICKHFSEDNGIIKYSCTMLVYFTLLQLFYKQRIYFILQ